MATHSSILAWRIPWTRGAWWAIVLLLLLLSRFSHVRLCDPMDCSPCQAPLSMGFSRQEYWSGLPCPPPGDLPDPGIESRSPAASALQVVSLPQATGEAPKQLQNSIKTNKQQPTITTKPNKPVKKQVEDLNISPKKTYRWSKAHEMLNITNFQRNASQN